MNGSGKGTILVVDDTLGSLKMMVEILVSEGYQVRPANSGPLALSSIDSQVPDLILLDIRMPDIDGFEICRRLKADPRTTTIPVIFLSAETDTKERLEGFAVGAVDFIGKPFQREELLARIGTHVELGRLRRRLEELVAQRTDELSVKNKDLEKSSEAMRSQLAELRQWYAATVNREQRVEDLKKEVNRLLESSGAPPKYFSPREQVTPTP